MFERLTDPDPPSGEDRRQLVRRDGLRRRARGRVMRLAVAAGAVFVLSVAVVQGHDERQMQDIGVATGPAEDTTTTTELPTTTSTVAVTTSTSTAAATTMTTTPTTHCLPWTSRPGSQPEHLEIVLTPDKPVFARSEPVTLTLRVRNKSDEPVTYSRGYGNEATSLLVRDRIGTLVFDSNHRQATAMGGSPTSETIGPGEERSAKLTWHQNYCRNSGDAHSPPYSMPAGRYVAEADWKKGWWAPPVTFDVT